MLSTVSSVGSSCTAVHGVRTWVCVLSHYRSRGVTAADWWGGVWSILDYNASRRDAPLQVTPDNDGRDVRNGLIKRRFVVWGFDMQIDMLIGLNRQRQWHIRISSHQMINIIANVILSPLCIELNDWPMIKWDGQEPRLGVTRWSLWLYGHPDTTSADPMMMTPIEARD